MTAGALDPEIQAFMGALAPPGAAPVERIETHAACVFLVGERAYKLKKPVDYGYLNFTSVEARRDALEAELRLNTPHAPSLYRRVLWIGRDASGALGLGAGATVEPVLEMTRFDQDALLDSRALAGHIDGALARDLADAVFESHARAPQRPRPGEAARMRGVLARVVQACCKESAAPAGRLGRLRALLDAQLCEQADCLDARGLSGAVRRCHGDLHLKNIVMLNQKPVLFDALEFDEALAEIDTLYDLAFLLMDLAHRGLDVETAGVLSQYAARLDPGDAEGLGLLPVFCGVRALIRAMTDYERGGDDDAADASTYLDLAERCAEPHNPRLIAIGGLSGTGKSTLAEALSPRIAPPPGAVVLRADLERKAMLDLSWRDRLPEAAYTRDASVQVYERQRRKAVAALQGGASVIVDAVHSRPEEREALEAIAKAARVSFTGFWLEADRSTLEARVAARTADPSDADLSVVAKQAGYDSGAVTWTRIAASQGPDVSLAQALEAMAPPNGLGKQAGP